MASQLLEDYTPHFSKPILGKMNMTHDISAKHVAAFICKMIRPFPLGISVMTLVALVWSIDLSFRPYLLKIILNRVADFPPSGITSLVLLPAGIYLFMSFLGSTVGRLYGYWVEIKMIPALRQRITETAFENLLEQSPSYYHHHFSGSLSNKINDLAHSIPDLVQIVMDRFFSNFLALAIAIFTLWQVNIWFGFFMLTWAFLFIGGAFLASKRIVQLSDTFSEWGSTVTGKIVDAFSNILSIHLFSRRKAEKESLQEALKEEVKTEQTLQWAYFWMWFIYGYSFVLVVGINLYLLIKGLREGWITVGDFALVLTLSSAVVDFLWQLAKEFSQFSKLWGRVAQAFRTLQIVPEVQDKPHAPALIVSRGEIVFEDVEFHYKRAGPLFQKKTVTISSGKKIGLVGYSGSGKTTFVNLILRLFDVTAGRISIDGQDIREVAQDSLHKAIGMIPQDPSLFHRTLKENIAYGRLEASEEEVIDAAKKAHAHEFIIGLPQGYDSLVGERGVKLSGGQRQRIAIARAILKNAPLLILDEATSQLDSVTEHFIQDSLWDLMQRKTTLVVAHRLSTLLHMDRILVFNQGKIVEDGTHQELLSKGGLYKILWDAQVGGFLTDVREN